MTRRKKGRDVDIKKRELVQNKQWIRSGFFKGTALFFFQVDLAPGWASRSGVLGPKFATLSWPEVVFHSIVYGQKKSQKILFF
jgi:hypothetical protein